MSERRCQAKGCTMTLLRYCGGGLWICWAHAMADPVIAALWDELPERAGPYGCPKCGYTRDGGHVYCEEHD